MLWSWEILTGFRTASVLKIGYLGAIVVPAIKYADPVLRSAGGNSSDLLGLSFLASIALAVAHVANEIFCPHLLRVYPTFVLYHKAISEYTQQHDIIATAQNKRRMTNLSREVGASLNVDDATRESLSQAILSTVDDLEPEPVSVLNTYEQDWEKANLSFAIVRLLVIFFYFVSAVLGLMLMYRLTLAIVGNIHFF